MRLFKPGPSPASSERAVEGVTAERVLAEEVRLLYQSGFAALANGVNAMIVAAALWHSFPARFLVAWTCLMWLTVAIRLKVRALYHKAPDAMTKPRPWARRFTACAVATGLAWGVVAAALAFFGQPIDYFFLAIVGAGMTAGALTSMASYLPAFLGYAAAFGAPLAAACIASPDSQMMAAGILTLAYLGVIAGTALNAHRAIRRTFELQIANASLNESLTAARSDLERVTRDKWTTLGHLSHELRTPLNAILGFSEAMYEQIFGPLGNPRYRDYAQHVHSSGQHLLNLSNEILNLSQSEAADVSLSESELDVAKLGRECVDLLAPRASAQRVALSCSIEPALPRLYADETKLRQILLNLISNAVKFSRVGGEVTFEARLGSDRGIELVVRDTGVGMAPQDIPRAMLPFVRLSNPLVQETEGTGLGLPISKKLAELHDAALAIASEPGKGTTCMVHFPPARTVGAEAVQTAPRQVAAGSA
jgi:signal transduction histidine kinase